jgi:large conductance mechanosensitive channel
LWISPSASSSARPCAAIWDLAVGVKIVSAVVSDMIMPPIARLVGNIDFTNLYFPLSDKVSQAQEAYAAAPATQGGHLPLDLAQKAGPVLAWGDFVTTTLNFVIVAFCIFLMIKLMNKLVKKEEAVAPPTPDRTALSEIRDLLKNRP